MSGRAVRKALQRQREAALLRQQSETPAESDNDDDEEEEEEPPHAVPQKPSLFALLGENEPEDEPDDDDEEDEVEVEVAAPVKKTNKKKKKKKKKPATPAAADTDNDTGKGKGKGKGKDKGKGKAVDIAGEDEIDRALRQLQLKDDRHNPATKPPTAASSMTTTTTTTTVPLSKILKIDTRNLDAEGEMRRLFGRAALKHGQTEDQAARHRQPGGPRGRVGAGRKNPFVQPQEDWPNLGSGGLGMEIASGEEFADEGATGGVTEFRFVHTRVYQDVQRQFAMCVLSLDTNRLLLHLQHNPYHITTLLQCAEIFHHQRDFAIAGQLLEKALFNLGRTLHSTFPQKLAEGTARMSFRRPENRELWLVCWRYIKNLSQRGTWRTAEEFARLLIALDPIGDPYEMALLVDQLALKARQPQRLLDLIEHPLLHRKFASYPSLAFSSALAYQQLGDTPTALEYLTKAITRFPWVPSRLYAELNIDTPLPPALWAAQAPEESPRQEILSRLYASRSADLWRDREATALLKTAVEGIYSLPSRPLLAPDTGDVPRSLARHILLSEDKELLSLLPQELKDGVISYDPLPPEGEQNLASYTVPTQLDPGMVGGGGGGGIGGIGGMAMGGGMQGDEGLMQFLRLSPEEQEEIVRGLMEAGAAQGGGEVGTGELVEALRQMQAARLREARETGVVEGIEEEEEEEEEEERRVG